MEEGNVSTCVHAQIVLFREKMSSNRVKISLNMGILLKTVSSWVGYGLRKKE